MGTAVWGPWHVEAFLELNLPTLLARSNLPALVAAIDTTYTIYTTAADADRLRTAPIFADLEALLPVEIEILSSESIGAPIETHQRIWRDLIELAKARASYVMLMPPDVAWSAGSLGHLAARIVEGKKAIFLNWHLRAIGQSFIPRFFERYGRGERRIDAPARELVQMSLEHAHPICGAALRTSASFPHHPEMIFWPVRDQGLLMHVLALTPFVFDPRQIALGPSKLCAQGHAPEDLHFVTDSDDVFMVSLAEIGKDAAWYRENHPLDPISVAQWWLYYDSPINDGLARAPFRLHFAEVVEQDWRRAQRSARALVQRLIATRELVRVWQLLKEMGCNLAAALLAYALEQGLALRLIPRQRPWLFLVPDDAGLRARWERDVGELLCPAGHAKLIALLRRHCIVGERALALEKLIDALLANAGAAPSGLTVRQSHVEINGVKLKTSPHQRNGYRGYSISEPLPDTEEGA